MTDAEIDACAQRCLRSVLRAFETHDLELLSEGDFTPLMRRALERLIEQTPRSADLRADSVDWASHHRKEAKLFWDLRAYLYEFSAGDKTSVQLTALDRHERVCEFAIIQNPSRVNRAYLPEDSGPLHGPWSRLAGFSSWFKIQALISQYASFGFSTRRLGEPMIATVKLPPGYFETLSEAALEDLLEQLSGVFRNCVRLEYDRVKRSALHIVLVVSPDKGGKYIHWAGGPPKDLWLADRYVGITD